MIRSTASLLRKKLAQWPGIIGAFDQRPHWARVLEALQYEEHITRDTAISEIDENNSGPLGLTPEEYRGAIDFLEEHHLITIENGEFQGLTDDGFEWIRDRQRTQNQAQLQRATSKLTLALVAISVVAFLDLTGVYLSVALGALSILCITVVYDILIRDY